MGIVAGRLFETIHPMTYLFVVQSIAWASLVMIHAWTDAPNILGMAGRYMFWPETVTYLWALSVIIVGLILIFFLLRDFYSRPRSRIWLMAKANVVVWVFSGVTWLFLGFWPLSLISIYNVLGFSYIGLASKLSRFNHRV